MNTLQNNTRPWIGVALDGVLAHVEKWTPDGDIGQPIDAMRQRVWDWMKAGYDVRVVTHRDPIQVNNWMQLHVGRLLPVTRAIDQYVMEVYDCRVVQVEINTGALIGKSTRGLAP